METVSIEGSTNRISQQTFASFQLRGQSEESFVLDIEFLVQFCQDEDLRSPVLGVRRTIFKSEEREASSRQSQSSDTISPLLLSAEQGKVKMFIKNQDASQLF